MSWFICPNCKKRSVDIDGVEGFSGQAPQCRSCGFGFLFELLDDYYPAPGTGFVVCDQERRIIAVGQGVFELTGYREPELLGRDVTEAFSIQTNGDANPADVAVEWGVRQRGKKITLTTRSGMTKEITADYFPAYDEDGGLLVALIPKA